jgi:hypothetical protein
MLQTVVECFGIELQKVLLPRKTCSLGAWSFGGLVLRFCLCRDHVQLAMPDLLRTAGGPRRDALRHLWRRARKR